MRSDVRRGSRSFWFSAIRPARAALVSAITGLCILCAGEARAGELAFPAGATDSTSLSFVFASTLETKLTLTETLTIPFLAGEGALTAGNNLRFELAGELSPVSTNATVLAALTPAAFLEFSTGAGIGTGWNIPIANGLRMNEPEAGADGSLTGERTLADESFGGAVWYWKGGGTFRFDFAAIVPGEWNHAVLQTYHGARYRAYSGAGADDSWLWEADEGENMNGWSYYGNYFAGYAMPIAVDLAGLLLENDTKLYGTDGGDSWGESQPVWTFGPLVNLGFERDKEGKARSSLTALAQWRAVRHFSNDTWENDFYQTRVLNKDDPWKRVFYRAALIYTRKLR